MNDEQFSGTFKLEKGRLYRMPVTFGPQPGPRQLPEGFIADHATYPRRRMASLTYSVSGHSLQKLLPERFSIRGEPTITIEVTHITESEWLAGRGYAILGVKAPVTFHGATEMLNGDFQLVYWESLADPIISGRVELGAPKLYCEIPEPRVLRGMYHYQCGWLGFNFFECELDDLHELQRTPTPRLQHEGLLYYKYSARTGGGIPDADYVTLCPAANSLNRIDKQFTATGTARFNRATWEDLPTMYHVVNALADLELGKCQKATLTFSHGGRDFGDQRIVK